MNVQRHGLLPRRRALAADALERTRDRPHGRRRELRLIGRLLRDNREKLREVRLQVLHRNVDAFGTDPQ
jgi:ribosomal 50S subunit-associated protein YjgA (DUF615 family)